MGRLLYICLVLPFGLEPVRAGDHQDLTWFVDEMGEHHTIRSIEDWEKRRESIVAGFEEAAGPLPSRESPSDLDIRVEESVETENYTRQTLTLQSEPDDRLSAYLYVPKGIAPGERRAGIVALHPTHKIGKGVVDGQSERPNRAYGKELAERGYVVIAPDYVSFGGETDYDFAADRYRSGTMKGIWNHMRCVDLLAERDDVDPQRIGAIGHSLGGHNAIFLGVFDQRVKAIVSSCGWTPFHDYYGGDIKGWTSDRYLPSLRDDYQLDPDRVPFDYYELVAALAPRAFFSNSPLHDSNFDYRGVEKAAPKVRRIYELYGVPDNLRIAYPDAEHDFPPAVKEEAFRWLDRWLGAGEK
ncbi:MAG: alpha/beta fold hydrolase [Verrucomicrobiae bacterium]|nr:alpha/beta fold hydrolase [Verrucomicrobiae bacterium]